jgi:beta-glucosidase
MNRDIDGLVKRMTLEEKVSILAGTDLWHLRGIKRLGIPAIKVTDGPYGARTISDEDPGRTIYATCFPTGTAMAATWNRALIQKVGEALGKETKDRGCAILLGPCVNIHRSPLGGRNFESFSEDPCLTASLAVALIQGIQSRRVGASIKHFALNNSEFQRFSISSEAAERTLREIYFPAFESAVEETQPWTVMCSYNRVNGVHASENPLLLSQVLKKEWGFKGFVMSDWFAVHSALPAAEAGLDLEMPGPARYFGEELIKAVQSGRIEESRIDDKVRRILKVVFQAGTGQYQPEKVFSPVRIRQHGNLARRVAEEAIVLLKNERSILPLKKNSLKTLAVIGPNAAIARFAGGGSSRVRPYYAVSPLTGLKELCGRSIKIFHEQGCRGNRLTPLVANRYLSAGETGKVHGLRAEYFSNHNFSGSPVLSRVERNFDLQWLPEIGPGRKLDPVKFSVRWNGRFTAPESGLYRFGLRSEGRVRLFMDGQQVIEKPISTAIDEFFSGSEKVGEIRLKAGKSCSLILEYSNDSNNPSQIRSLRLGCELPFPPDMLQKAVKTAAAAEVALVFAGLSDEYETEGFDRENMDLPEDQVQLIKAIAAVNPNTVVVLNNGSPLAMTGWEGNVPCILEAWFAGQEGGNAVASVLFGETNPSGKLPDTFPLRLEDNPAYPNYPGSGGKVHYAEGIFVGYRYYDTYQVAPLFPFGHGLSYTTFSFSNLRIKPLQAEPGEKIKIDIDITNTGRRSGQEVVQLYLRDLASSFPRPLKELKGFRKIALKRGETGTAVFTLEERDLSFFDPNLKQWVAEAGEFEVLIGSSSRDIRARAVFTLLK